MTFVRAMLFDVFGTLVDWRTGIAREAERVLQPLGYNLDWTDFADVWRGEYQPGMEEVRSGRIPFCKLDVLHRRNLERFMPRFGLRDLSDDVLHELTLAWHRLDAWPEVPAALKRLKKKFLLAPVSNGNISLMVDLARRNDFGLGRNPRRRGCRRLQTKAARLSRRLRSIRSQACALHDGGGAQQRPRRCGGMWVAHWSHRATGRARSRDWRARADRAGGCGGERFG